MKCRWIDKNVKIPDIEEAVKSFLQEHRFKIVPVSNKDSREIIGILESTEGKKKVIVKVTGEAEDFTVDFAAGEVAKIMAKLASNITFFGGGPFQLKSLKEKEFYQKIENELWGYLEKFIAEKSQS